MLALYRSGRQAEALAAYRDARSVYVEELGIEPTRRLQELEQAILRQDASLDAPARRGRTPAAPPAGERKLATILVAALAGVSRTTAIPSVRARCSSASATLLPTRSRLWRPTSRPSQATRSRSPSASRSRRRTTRPARCTRRCRCGERIEEEFGGALGPDRHRHRRGAVGRQDGPRRSGRSSRRRACSTPPAGDDPRRRASSGDGAAGVRVRAAELDRPGRRSRRGRSCGR